MHRLLCNLLVGKVLSKDLLKLIRSSGFTLLRSDAQEGLSKRNNSLHSDIPQRLRSLCELIFGFEALQRVGTNYGLLRSVRISSVNFGLTGRSAFYGSKAGAGLGLLELGSPPKKQNSLSRRICDVSCDDTGIPPVCLSDADPINQSLKCTASPTIVEVLSHSIEIDLHECVDSFLRALAVSDALEPKTPMNITRIGKLDRKGFSNRIAPMSPLSLSLSLSMSQPQSQPLSLSQSLSQPQYQPLSLSQSLGPNTPIKSVDVSPITPKTDGLPSSFIESDNHSVIIEVALAVASSNNDNYSDDDDDNDNDKDDSNEEAILFETVYCGTCMNYKHVGLSPECTYILRCRVTSYGVVLDWSKSVKFQTKSGIAFTFDPYKCGSDITLKNGNLIASYNGDDTWSTLLGTHPYSSGKINWEIKIIQSSTAYFFIGVARSEVDLNTFLGGCNNGWGFIGEQALYHNRENVKGYGEAFNAGDYIGIYLDFYLGTIRFTRNGKQLGLAFDRICGEIYPAIAFYNVGQEVEILTKEFHSSCCQDNYQCSPAKINLHGKINQFILFLLLFSPIIFLFTILFTYYLSI